MSKTVKILARVDLTEERKADLSDRMSNMVLSINELEEDKKQYAADANAEIKTIEADLKELARVVKRGFEERNVECYSVEDWPRKIRRFYSVEDNRLIDTKPIGQDEAQKKLWQGNVELLELIKHDLVTKLRWVPYYYAAHYPWASRIPVRLVRSGACADDMVYAARAAA